MYAIGIDIGTSTTKLAVIDEAYKVIITKRLEKEDQPMLEWMIDKLSIELGMNNENCKGCFLTGVGASFFEKDSLAGYPVCKVDEIKAIGAGGLQLAGVDSGLVVSIGTGTAFVNAEGNQYTHLGGSCLGGGTLVGLGKLLLNEDNSQGISHMAEAGDMCNVDLCMVDVTKENVSFLPEDATAAHFAKVTDKTTSADVARSLLNMISQNIAVMAFFCCQNVNKKNVILIGGMTSLSQTGYDCSRVGELYHIDFKVPEHASYAVAIGACVEGMPLL